MPTDRYTKSILTIIATCLVFLCFHARPSASKVFAEDAPKPQEVKIVGIAPSTVIPVSINGAADGSMIPVRIDGSGANFVVPVAIINGRGTIPVSIQNVNPIPVGIKAVGFNNNTWGWYPLAVKQQAP